MNPIAELQNQPQFLEKLAASNRLYDQSVRIAYLQLLTAISIAVIFPAIANEYPQYSGYLTVGTLFYFLIQIFCLDNWETNKRVDATILQELFDTELFALNWNPVVAGEKLDHARLNKHLAKNKIIDKEELHNWYPPAVAEVPLPIARIMCQRSSAWWNGHLRQTCSNFISGLAIVILAGVIIQNFNLPLEKLATHIILFLPLFEILATTSLSYRQSAERMGMLTRMLDSFLQQYSQDPTFEVDQATSRAIQDEIFRNRSSARPTPRFIYAMLLSKYKKIMNLNAHDFIVEYTKGKI